MKNQTAFNKLIQEIQDAVYITVMPRDYIFTPEPDLHKNPTGKQIAQYIRNSPRTKQSKGKQ